LILRGSEGEVKSFKKNIVMSIIPQQQCYKEKKNPIKEKTLFINTESSPINISEPQCLVFTTPKNQKTKKKIPLAPTKKKTFHFP
jgi:hypothetical protein